MMVYKFGGASIKSAKGIKNVANIIKAGSPSSILVVVSAMGKTTNALEEIVSQGQAGKEIKTLVNSLLNFHLQIIDELEIKASSLCFEVEDLFDRIYKSAITPDQYDRVYDQIVSMGEVISSLIVSRYLNQVGTKTEWIDARKYIHTDNTWREGKVDWQKTHASIKTLKAIIKNNVIVTQGFIGGTNEGLTATLGREGSDYSAAIFASSLPAQSVTIWKDVPGVMSADPKRIPNAIVFDELPYQEAAEMTYYGASVIHPKTIKPLANAKIPLLVKNFDDPSLPGTRIHDCKIEKLPALIVFKENQCLISCKVMDFTFVSEHQLRIIFQTLAEHNISINVMQNSAISFSFCVDFKDHKIMALIHAMSKHFEVYYNTGLTLITLKNYTTELAQEYRNKHGIVLEQASRSTLQLLVRH